MKVFEYPTYADYVAVQTDGNRRKINGVYVQRENVHFLGEYIKTKITSPVFGLCHGTRRGLEQKWFKEVLKDCIVLGTEISDTAVQFENTIQWDFHDTLASWIGQTDFIYSNSLDHSCKPKECLEAWLSCLKPDGLCILEWGSKNLRSTKLDPFSASMDELVSLAKQAGGTLVDILDAPVNPKHVKGTKFLVLKALAWSQASGRPYRLS